MACFNRMPDLVISLDTVFYPDFDVSISTNIIHVVFYLPAIKMTIVKKLREGVSYNKARNKLYIWLTDDDLQHMKRSQVQVQVRVIDIFNDGVLCSNVEWVNTGPIIIKRDKMKAKTFKIDYDDSEYKRFMNFLKYGDRCNQNDHDDAIDALRYATENWLRTKHDIIGKVTDIHITTNGLNLRVTHCNNHTDIENMFPNVCELAEEKGFENLMKLIDRDTYNPYLECLFCDTHHQPFYNGNHTNREKEKPMKTKKDIDRIVITKDGENGVLLRAYSDDEIVEKTIAKCSPDDIFDFNIGAKFAVDRLYDGYDMTPKPKRKPYNGMIFVAKYPGVTLKPNTLYRVGNGFIYGLPIFSFRKKEPYIFENMSDDDLTKAVYHTLYSSDGTMDQIKRSTAVHFVKE